MFGKYLMYTILCLAISLYLGCKGTEEQTGADGTKEIHEQHKEDNHEGKNEEGHQEHSDHQDGDEKVAEHQGEGHGEHEGEAPNEHAGHEEKGEGHAGPDEGGPEVGLSAKAMEIAGITIDKVKVGKISEIIELAGEVGFNEDRVANVVPRFPGIVKQVHKNLGDYVTAGESLASIESNESLSSYKIKSLISGRVIEKHVTLGEFASEESTVYVIADLSTVWVNLAVYAKDVQNVRVGQMVTIEAIGNNLQTEGKISYIGPVYNEQTRNLVARVVIPNSKNIWRPGTFVRGIVPLEAHGSVMVVSENALQRIGEKLCVFVPEKGEKNVFRAVEVVVEERDGTNAHVISGLSVGDEYVTKGAYELKGKLITSSLGGHAGHGH